MKKLIFALLLCIGLLVLPAVSGSNKADAAFVINFNIPNAAKIKRELTINNEAHLITIKYSNLIFAKKISYELTYDHDGGTAGIEGTIKVKGLKPIVREITLGTCSAGGTCVFHSNVTNIQLKTTTQYSIFNKTETTIDTL